MEGIVESLLEAAILALEVVGAVVILATAAQVALFMATGIIRDHTVTLGDWRTSLGKGLVLGLEFLIGADILRTIVAPTLDELARLGAIVLLRMVLSFSIEFELRQAEKRGSGGPSDRRAGPRGGE